MSSFRFSFPIEIGDIEKRIGKDGSKISLLSGLITFLVVKPEAVTSIQWLDNLIDAGIFALAALYVIAVMRKRIGINFATSSLAVYIVYHLMVVLMKTPIALFGEISSWLRVFVGFSIISEMFERDYLNTLNGMSRCSFVLLVADIVSGCINFVFGSESLKIRSILGTDIYSIFVIIPLLSIVIVNSEVNNASSRRNALILFSICTLQKIATGAATAGVALVLLGVFLLLIKNKPRIARLLVKPSNGLIILIVFTLLFAVFRATEAFTPLFEALGKDQTMNGRTIIWAATVPEIMKEFLLGHGMLDPIDFVTLMGFNPWDIYYGHCHNMVLEILFRDGVIGFILMAVFLATVLIPNASSGRGFKNQKNMEELRIVVQAFLFASCILWITDGYPSLAPIYMMFALYRTLGDMACMRRTEDEPRGLMVGEENNG